MAYRGDDFEVSAQRTGCLAIFGDPVGDEV